MELSASLTLWVFESEGQTLLGDWIGVSLLGSVS